MKHTFTHAICTALAALVLAAPASAQTKEELALEIARITVPDQFKPLKPLLEGFLDNLQKQAQSNGKSDRVLEIWTEELKSSMNPESLTKIVADMWAKELTLPELQQVLFIVRSPVYKRLNEVGAKLSQPQALAPIFHEACERAGTRARNIGLGTRDLDSVCKQFAPPPKI